MTGSSAFYILDDDEIDLVAAGAASDAWGAIAGGLGLIAVGVGLEGATYGLGTPIAFGVIAAGVASVHAGVIQLATDH